MTAREALQRDHTVSLLTLTRPDFAGLNSYFNIDVNPVPVWHAQWAASALELVGLPLYNPVGRLARYKNVEETICIVDGVRECSYDIYHHIVASSYDRDYQRKLEAMVTKLDSISLEGDSRTRNSSACSVRTATDSMGSATSASEWQSPNWLPLVRFHSTPTTAHNAIPSIVARNYCTVRNAGGGRREDREYSPISAFDATSISSPTASRSGSVAVTLRGDHYVPFG